MGSPLIGVAMTPTYTDIMAREIHAAGWSWGTVSYVQDGRQMHVADARHVDGWRCIARAESELTALVELREMIREHTA